MIQFAIVDIETTGGSADRSGITEIAIRVWDGANLVETFTSLVNPEMPIPLSIQTLTGIDNEMVSQAPTFSDLAETIYTILKDRVFVAHNVHFDYSFIHFALYKSGFDLRTKKLCTVRLSRKILPGIPSYSLSRLTEYLSIPHHSKHRAGGDADATLILFEHLVKSDTHDLIQKSLKQESSLGKFPPKLPLEDINRLPDKPGVYFFKNEKGKIIYVGKAINIKKRVISHFTGNSVKKQKQEFIQKVAGIDTEPYSTELMALIYESHEIKRLWPELNRAQKRREDSFGIFEYTDQHGFKRLGIDKIKSSFPSVYTFGYYLQGIELLRMVCEEFKLLPELCSLSKRKFTPDNHHPDLEQNVSSIKLTDGDQPNFREVYNNRVDAAIAYLQRDRSFAIMDKGFQDNEQSCILILKGEWIGMGYLPIHIEAGAILNHIHKLKPLKINSFIRQTLYSFAVNNPGLVSVIPEEDLERYFKRKSKNTNPENRYESEIRSSENSQYVYETSTLLF